MFDIFFDEKNRKIRLKFIQEDGRIIFNIMQEIGGNLDEKKNNLFLDFSFAKDLISFFEKNNLSFGKDCEALLNNIIEENDIYKNFITQNRHKSFLELENNESFEEYSKKILSEIDVSIEGEFSEITKKQITKTFSLSQLENSINFSEPGSGKTIMTLMKLVTDIENDNKIIIVSPKNSMNVWYDEIKKFLKWTNDLKLIHFFNDDMHKIFSDEKQKQLTDFSYAKFILINYESVQKISDNETIMLMLKNTFGFHVVFDEAHRVKNNKSIRNSYCKKLSKHAISRSLLTGTPFSTSVSEVVEMILLTWPKGNPFISEEKLSYYSEEISMSNMKEEEANNIHDTKNLLDNFIKEIKPLFFNLKKVKDFGIMEAIDLHNEPNIVPPLNIQIKIDKEISEKISSLQRMMLIEKDKNKKKDLERYLNIAHIRGIQNSTNPYLLKETHDYGHFFNEIDDMIFSDLPKIKEALIMVQKLIANNKRVIVWFFSVENIRQFNKLLIENKINSKMIYGDTDHLTRRDIISDLAFEDSEIQVLVANAETISESISLHKSIWNSIFVERTYSYFRWAQARDRVHRVGSTHQVEHFYIKTDDLKFENKLFENLSLKDKIANSILSGEMDAESFVELDLLQKEEEKDPEIFGNIGDY